MSRIKNPQANKNLRFFSYNIVKLLKQNKINQLELSKATGIPKTTINGYVNGTSLPTLKNLQRIVDYFKIPKAAIDLRFKNSNSLKERRKELNLTLEDVGNYVGVGKSTVKKWEDGAISNMKRDKIVLLSEILKINPLELLDSNSSSTNNRYYSDLENIYNQLSSERKDCLYVYAKCLLNDQQSTTSKRDRR